VDAGARLSTQTIEDRLGALQLGAEWRSDVFTFAESRLFESRLNSAMVPSSRPVDAPLGSGFGIRSDPFTGRPALHTGLDFAADIGTPVLAAAGGVVQAVETHPEYGRLLEIHHGNGLVTRYAHNSQIQVKVGEVVKRGQQVAAVGNSGRSTGPHLHFEVLLEGVPQNPMRFLGAAARTMAAASGPRALP
jgi:murein DD-endopeptidase MepM/ murein hydrolase activator NlpD